MASVRTQRGSYIVEIQVNTATGVRWTPTHAKPFVMPDAAMREYQRFKRHKLPLRILNKGELCELING